MHRHEADVAELGDGNETTVVLHEDPQALPAGRHAGLYHYALLYPSREELARAVLRIAATRTPIDGASDHETHEAIYLPDADGNGIELAADRPREQWPDHLGYAGGPKPLDVDDLMATVAGEDVTPQVGPGLRMGHVHLHVGDIDEGLRFYRDAVGFEREGADRRLGRVRVAPAATTITSASTPGAARASRARRRTAPACVRWTVQLPTAADVEAVRERLDDTEPFDGGFLARDPWGTAVAFVAAPRPDRISRHGDATADRRRAGAGQRAATRRRGPRARRDAGDGRHAGRRAARRRDRGRPHAPSASGPPRRPPSAPRRCTRWRRGCARGPTSWPS